MKRILWAIAIALMGAGTVGAADSGTNAPAAGEIVLFDGKTLKGWKATDFAGKGEVRVEDGLMVLEQGYLTGVTYTNAVPKGNYELQVEAKRVMGNDFFCGLTFPIAGTNVTLILGGWGGGLVGISSIDGLDASENETMKIMSFQRDRWYAVRVRVTADKLEAWLDQEKIVDVATKNRRFSLRSGPIEESVPLGIATYETKAHIRKVVVKKLD